MKTITKLLVVLLSLWGTSAHSAVKTSAVLTVYDTVMQRIQSSAWANVNNVATLNSNVATDLSTLTAQGSWPDVVYTSTSQTGWSPDTHLNRLTDMVLAYTLSTSSYCGNASLFTNITNALQYWYNVDPNSTNWWYRQINNPQKIGVMLILMRTGAQPLSSTLESNLIARMASEGSDPSTTTAANKVDIATHWVYRGCLTQNASVLSYGLQQAFSTISIQAVGSEGLQNDNCYQAHGPQLSTAAYGAVFISGVAKLGIYTAGTAYQLAADKLQLLTSFARDDFFRIIRGRNFLYNPLGRGLSRQGALSAGGQTSTANLLKSLDSANSTKYDTIISRLNGSQSASYGVSTKHTHFWQTDYSLFTSAAYNFDVRMASTRTYRNENGNGENLKGYFLSEGAYNISVDGTEYFDVFPVWDWARVPGITAPHKTTIPQPVQWGTYGTSTFAGGVSNGSAGVTTFSLNNNEYSINTSAKKSWFMFGNEIVCLGAAIKSMATESINTTINQCKMSGSIVVHANGAETTLGLGASNNYNNTADWIYHNNVGYFFPQGGNLNVSSLLQSGTWNSINSGYSTATVSSYAFQCYLNHGTLPVSSTYAYVIVPGQPLTSIRNYVPANNVGIMANTDSVQVVWNKLQNLWGLVFYKAASYSNGNFTIKTDGACAIMLKNPETTSVQGWISDPSQTKSSVTLRFVSAAITTEKLITQTMPTGLNAGSTTTFNITGGESAITDVKTITDFDVFPIPARKGQDTWLKLSGVQSSHFFVMISDLNGRKVAESSYSQNQGNNLYQIKTSSLASGVFFVSVTDAKKNILGVRKMILI